MIEENYKLKEVQLVEEKVNVISRRIKLKTALLLFLIAVAAMAVTAFAWFTISSLVGLDGMQMSVGSGVNLLVSTEDHGTDLTAYSHTITNDMINSELTKYNTKLSDFILMPLTSSDGTKFYTQSGGLQSENKNTYLEATLYFIATEDMWVHLTTSNSSSDKDDGTKVTTTSSSNQAKVTQCTRVAFVSNDKTAIYEPNKSSAVAGQNTFDLPQGTMVYSDNTRLFHLNKSESKKVTVRVWLEGEDPQCTDDVQKANLGVQLCFIGTNDNNELLS